MFALQSLDLLFRVRVAHPVAFFVSKTGDKTSSSSREFSWWTFDTGSLDVLKCSKAAWLLRQPERSPT